MIQKLPAQVSDLVCATQVIPNVTSCIKELVDNALDAKAMLIRVVLEDYGKKMIEVSDDGIGIPSEQLNRICHRGATSKLKHFNDVHEVKTLGFRGEALNALINVSHMTIETKTMSENEASLLSDNMMTKKEASYAQGTKVQIRKLFHNVVVREKQWHQNCKSTLSSIVQLLKQYSLIYIKERFMLISKKDGQTTCLYDSTIHPKCESYRDLWLRRVESVLGTSVSDSIDFIEGPSFQGWISKMLLGKINTNTLKRNILYMYFNRRPVDFMPSLQKQLDQLLKQWNIFGKYVCILNITKNVSDADITSTPDKRHLFLRCQRELIRDITNQVKKSLEKVHCKPKEIERRSAPVMLPVTKQPPKQVQDNKATKTNMKERFSKVAARVSQVEPIQKEIKPAVADNKEVASKENSKTIQVECLNSQNDFRKQDFQQLTILGQFNLGFVVCLLNQKLYVVDQHAASEKTNFEQLLQKPSGEMTVSKTITLSPYEASLVEAKKQGLTEFGYEFEQSVQEQKHKITISKYPIHLDSIFNHESFIELCKDYVNVGDPTKHPTVLSKAALKACHMSIRIGDLLKKKDMVELVHNLSRLQSPWNCPHGRPTIVKLEDASQFARQSQLTKIYSL